MNEQIRVPDFFEGGLEGLDQSVGQSADEADRIDKNKIFPFAEGDLSVLGVEGRKEHVLGVDFLALDCPLKLR